MMKGFVPGNINVPLKQTLAGTNVLTQLKVHTHHVAGYLYTLFICSPGQSDSFILTSKDVYVTFMRWQ